MSARIPLAERAAYYAARTKAMEEQYRSMSPVDKVAVDRVVAEVTDRFDSILGVELGRESNGVEVARGREAMIARTLEIRRRTLRACAQSRPFCEDSDGEHPGMVLIPAGRSVVGMDRGVLTREEPSREVDVPGFWIDTWPVTNTEYETVIAGHARDEHSPADDSPVTCINWFEAQRYCAKVGKRLPTATEWESAARGPSQQNLVELLDRGESAVEAVCWPSNGVAPPGPAFRSPWGLGHMCGNIWEWTKEVHSHEFAQNRRIYYSLVRGGSWRHCRLSARPVSELAIDLVHRADNIGFRCVLPE